MPMKSWHLMPIGNTTHFFISIVVGTAIFVALLALLHRLPPRMKKYLIISCTFIAGLFTVTEYLWPTRLVDGEQVNPLTPYLQPVFNYWMLILVWTIGLGVISLAIVHGRRLVRRQPGWHNSLAFFIALCAMLIAGFACWGGMSDRPMYKTYDVLFRGLLVNLDAAMFSLLAFYIASAAYRAFRVRTVEAALLMCAALIVMLGFVSFGVKLTSWLPTVGFWSYFRMENLSAWILNWINSPGYRAVIIGVEVGALAMAMRLWLSLERGAFFSQES